MSQKLILLVFFIFGCLASCASLCCESVKYIVRLIFVKLTRDTRSVQCLLLMLSLCSYGTSLEVIYKLSFVVIHLQSTPSSFILKN